MNEQSRIRRFRTWVKVDGVYPGPIPCEGHRSKDRMILAIGAVKRIDGGTVPAHTVSIEMGPVLRHFRDLTDELEEPANCPWTTSTPDAELHRGELVIATCALRVDQDGDHLEVGSPEPLDNWPPRARLRWSPDVTSFRRYDSTDEPTWNGRTTTSRRRRSIGLSPGSSDPGSAHASTGTTATGSSSALLCPTSVCSCRTDETSTRLRHSCTGSPPSFGGIPEGRLLNSARLYVVPSDHDALITLERFWAERLTGDSLDAWVEELNYAPMPLGSDSGGPVWATEGFLYVAAGAIRRAAGQGR